MKRLTCKDYRKAVELAYQLAKEMPDTEDSKENINALALEFGLAYGEGVEVMEFLAYKASVRPGGPTSEEVAGFGGMLIGIILGAQLAETESLNLMHRTLLEGMAAEEAAQ